MADAVITGWSAISPFGVGAAAFVAGLAAGRSGRLVPDFDIETVLGRKGTFGMDRASALAVHTVAGLLAENPVTATETAVVLGTTSGSAQTQVEFATASLTRRKPYFVEPAMMPFGLMNSAAAQCALWHGLTGPNTTIADGPVAGLSALDHAVRLLATGRAGAVLCGGVEEASPAREWLTGAADGQLGEGCAVLLVEPAGAVRPAMAEVLGHESRICLDGDVPGAVARCVRRLLDGADAADVLAVSPSGPVDGAVLAEICGAARHIAPGESLGDTGAASAAFQLVALLAGADRAGLAVATSVDPDGKVVAVLLRLAGQRIQL